MKSILYVIVVAALAVFMTGCIHEAPSSDKQQSQAQEALAKQANATVGMPAIVNFQEKRTYKDIWEMRDKAIVTVTYTQDMNGRLHKICDSIGFGIPYATQFTNPQRVVGSEAHSLVTVPQADPNGLFSPESADGTWVLCKRPDGKEVAPVLIEPRIIVSPFPLN